jgi:hypothetical protein
LLGLADRVVRERVCAWRVRGQGTRGWAQLYRWARKASVLFTLPRPVAAQDVGASVRQVLSGLRALAPGSLSRASVAQQVFAGAVHMR